MNILVNISYLLVIFNGISSQKTSINEVDEYVPGKTNVFVYTIDKPKKKHKEPFPMKLVHTSVFRTRSNPIQKRSRHVTGASLPRSLQRLIYNLFMKRFSKSPQSVPKVRSAPVRQISSRKLTFGGDVNGFYAYPSSPAKTTRYLAIQEDPYVDHNSVNVVPAVVHKLKFRKPKKNQHFRREINKSHGKSFKNAKGIEAPYNPAHFKAIHRFLEPPTHEYTIKKLSQEQLYNNFIHKMTTAESNNDILLL